VSDVTRILERAQAGDPQAANELLPLVYDELRRLAAHRMANENPGQTLQATALVHEAWLKLAGAGSKPRWNDRAHFFAAAAEAMRRILIDNARRKRTAKHGGGWVRIETTALDLPASSTDEDLLALNEALDRLAMHDSTKAELVKLRYFAGLTLQQAAQALELSTPTAKRYWTYARAWLFREMTRDSAREAKRTIS
jgi:RNA polymerase sigma factor (TIGR02999 family)